MRRLRPSRNASCGPSAPGIQSSGIAARPLRLEELLLRGRARADVRPAELGQDAAARRPLEKAQLEQIGLADVFDRVRLLAQGHGESAQPDWASAELEGDRLQQLPVDP